MPSQIITVLSIFIFIAICHIFISFNVRYHVSNSIISATFVTGVPVCRECNFVRNYFMFAQNGLPQTQLYFSSHTSGSKLRKFTPDKQIHFQVSKTVYRDTILRKYEHTRCCICKIVIILTSSSINNHQMLLMMPLLINLSSNIKCLIRYINKQTYL